MRRIRANAIAILTVAWILGTFYYLWQDNKPHSAASSRSPGSGRSGQRSAARLESRREDGTIPLIVTRAPQAEKSSLRGFDEKAYLSSKLLKAGEDPYRQHAFNQLESEKLSSDRPIRDTRHYRVLGVLSECTDSRYSSPATTPIVMLCQEP